ncbi:MAG: hypothetical protein KAH21_05645 [Spirochaetaceae bacterium]|nr:hypothetical protein [Spirochaetaceae bacterium]
MRSSKTEKELHMQLWRESGLSKVEYATQSGLTPHAFYGWFKKTKQEKQSAPEFVEIQRSKNQSEKYQATSIKITLSSGYEITADPGFDRIALSTILDVLERRR